MHQKTIKPNGFLKSQINNSTSYQSNFNDAEFSTSSKNFMNSPLAAIENRKATKRADSLIARSATYSNIPCPHCDRKFSTAAAERHIPICNSIISKPGKLKKSLCKRPSVQLPHLSKTSYGNGGFESNLMNNTSSTFRSSAAKFPKQPHNYGLPPTYKANTASSGDGRMKNNFTLKKWYWGSCGERYRNKDKFWSTCGDKRVII